MRMKNIDEKPGGWDRCTLLYFFGERGPGHATDEWGDAEGSVQTMGARGEGGREKL